VRLDALIPTDGPSLAYRDEMRQHYLKVRDLAAKQIEELLAGIQELRTKTESTAT
jgi:hypothetical protein